MCGGTDPCASSGARSGGSTADARSSAKPHRHPWSRRAAVTGVVLSAETRLTRLLDRLLTAAEASLAAGDLDQARAPAEEVRAVDPGNRRAAGILQQAAARQLGPSGERALMTLLFSDLVGSTVLSERVEP